MRLWQKTLAVAVLAPILAIAGYMALHNIYDAGERQGAVREIARVLKSGGRVLIVDVRYTRQYAATLRDSGLDARCIQGILSRLLTVVTFGSIQSGYVIGSKAGPG